MKSEITKHAGEIGELCQKYGVIRLHAFGSAVRDDFSPDSSDIDLIASFAKTKEAGYADRYLDFAESLEGIFGRRVDLLTPGALHNSRFHESVSRESVLIYESKNAQAA